MDLKAIADKTIPQAENKKVLKKNGETQDIIKEVLECYRDSRVQLLRFAPYLKGNTVLETCYNIWSFWKTNIRYQVDAEGVQWVKTPAAVWASKFCDCKSFSVAIACCLDALGIKGKFRFVSYGLNKEVPTHVYVVAFHQGREIIIDCVWHSYNSEKPYTKKWEYNMTAIYRISGIGNAAPVYKPGELNIDVNNPNLTEAELELALHKQEMELMQKINRKNKIGAIGSPLDNAYQVEIEAANAALKAISGHGIGGKKRKERRLKKAIKANDGKGVNKRQAKLLEKAGIAVKKRKEGLLKRVAKGLKKVIKAIPRLVVRTQLQKSAPFFLYTFITDPKVIARLPETVRIKKAKADRYKNIIVGKLEMKPEIFDKAIRNGIMKHMGDTPENILAKWMQEANFSVGIVAIIGVAAKFLWDIIKKLAGKAVENMKNDVAQYTPDKTDWTGVSAEDKKEMAEAQKNSYDDGVKTFEGNANAAEGSEGAEGADGQPFDNDRSKTLDPVELNASRPQTAGGGVMILVGLAALALMAGGKRGSKKRA
ncbi:MAG: hypothetical protein IT254_07090 [Chitinophagaceae bacterium]|nr:hypothetical protein [Chitinophagaceae bacterium]